MPEKSERSKKPVKYPYVVRLDNAVLEVPAFRKENPDHRPGKPCAYVGVTSLDPDERIEKHKQGIKAGRKFVTKYGMHPMRRQFERLNPVPADEAEEREQALAAKLRCKGYAVWQN